MKQKLIIKNKDLIIKKLKQKYYLSNNELQQIFRNLKLEKLIPQAMSFYLIYAFFIEIGLTVRIVKLNNKIIERYTVEKNIKVYDFANSIITKSFFSMSTALNLQGYADYRTNYIFISAELTAKKYSTKELNQELIDDAYKKSYRLTQNYGEFEGNQIILLYPKHTSQFEIINFNEFKISSINRSFVEMIVNMQYFQTSLTVIKIFKPLQLQLNLIRIFEIIEKFNFIYPYYQLFGHMLERIGVDRSQLKIFKTKVENLKFYTDKNQLNYLYDNYWQIFYID